VSCVTSWTLRTHDDVFVDLNARPSVGTPAGLTVLRCPPKSIPVVPSGAQLAIVTSGVVLTDASPGLRFADVGVFVAITRDARHERTTKRWRMSESWLAGLAELADVAGGACALFDPKSRSACDPLRGGLQADVVQVARASRGVGGSDSDGSQVAQDGHEGSGGEARLPTVVRMFVQAEAVLLILEEV
jgi:hypothetical protein